MNYILDNTHTHIWCTMLHFDTLGSYQFHHLIFSTSFDEQSFDLHLIPYRLMLSDLSSRNDSNILDYIIWCNHLIFISTNFDIFKHVFFQLHTTRSKKHNSQQTYSTSFINCKISKKYKLCFHPPHFDT